MLQHLARAVLVDPDRGVVEHAGRRAVHVVTGLLPRLVVADDRASVLAVRLEVGRPFDDVDGRAKLFGARPGLERGRERAPQGVPVSLGVREVGQAKARLRVARVLRQGLLELLRRRAGIPRPREDVGDSPRHLFPVGPAALQAIELGERGLVVVAREEAIEIHLRVGVELLDVRGDLVRLGGGAVLVEGLEVRVQGGDVVREALREVGEGPHPIAVPAEMTVEERELLQHLGLRRHLLRERSKRFDGFGRPALLGVADDGHEPRAPERGIPGKGAAAQGPSARCARVLREGGVGRHERRGHLERERGGVFGLDERADERRRDVVHLVHVRRVGGERRGHRVARDRERRGPDGRAHERLDRVRVVEHQRGDHGRRRARVRVGRNAGSRPVRLEDAHAGRRRQSARHDPVSAVVNRHVRPGSAAGAPPQSLARAPSRRRSTGQPPPGPRR